MQISRELYSEILHSTENPPPESGGILGGYNGKVTVFVSDKGRSFNADYKYEPDIVFLNEVIDEWLRNNIEFMGIYHSHPKNHEKMSVADLEYINKIMRSVKGYADRLYFPLVIPKEKIICFYALIVADEIQIFHDAIQLK
ncbi:MAG: Mov34/MPN/PAD-1 family protein [Clostridia bacterium]|nr:Mov34/MPN/PAD-1 family protein [Clostridia bacterium]